MTNSEARNPHATPPTPDALAMESLREDIRSVLDEPNPDSTAEWWAEKADLLLAALDEARAEVERVRRGARTLGHIVETQGRDALDASGMHHVIGEDGDGDWAVVWEVLAELRPRAERAEARATAAESARDAAEGAIERVRALYGPLVPRASVAGSAYSTGRWEAFAEVRNVLDSTPANDAAEVEDGVFGDTGIHARLTRAALAPLTTDETEGGGES